MYDRASGARVSLFFFFVGATSPLAVLPDTGVRGGEEEQHCSGGENTRAPVSEISNMGRKT